MAGAGPEDRVQTTPLLDSLKILYVSQYFPPEMGAPAARVSELSDRWAAAGHQVTVLTGFPNHPTGVVARGYRAKILRLVHREKMGDVNVVRTWLLPLANRRAIERILNYTSFLLSACITGLFLKRPDVVIGTSPQLLVGLAGWWLGLVKRAPFVLEIRDIWPDSIAASGVASRESLMNRSIGSLSRFLYRASRRVVVVTSAFKEELVSKWDVPTEKIDVVENGVETDLFTPEGTARNGDDDLAGKFVISYIGTIGMAHGLEVVVEAASQLSETHRDILFMVVGEGAEKQRLIAEADKRNLQNLRFMPSIPRTEIPSQIRASDVCLVLLKKAPIFETVIPTKMLEFMSCGRPVILGVDGQARRVLEEGEAGLFVEPESVPELVRTVVRLYEDEPLRTTLGENGRKYAEERLSRKATAADYLIVLESIVGGPRQSKLTAR